MYRLIYLYVGFTLVQLPTSWVEIYKLRTALDAAVHAYEGVRVRPELTIIPVRPPVELDPQRCFNPNQRVAIFRRAKGRCELCGVKVRGAWYAGHIKPHALGGRTEIDNGRVEGIECGCAKDTHREDTTTAAKTERMALRKGQQKRRNERGGSCIQSRGFDKSLIKKMNGEVVPRAKAARRAMKENKYEIRD